MVMSLHQISDLVGGIKQPSYLGITCSVDPVGWLAGTLEVPALRMDVPIPGMLVPLVIRVLVVVLLLLLLFCIAIEGAHFWNAGASGHKGAGAVAAAAAADVSASATGQGPKDSDPTCSELYEFVGLLGP